MGLEAMNLYFHSAKQIKSVMLLDENVKFDLSNRYSYKKEGEFWIDLQFDDECALSIRITLCNNSEKVLAALYKLLMPVFLPNECILFNWDTKETFNVFNIETMNNLKKSYENRKLIFKEMYDTPDAAIGSDEFYQIQLGNRSIK